MITIWIAKPLHELQSVPTMFVTCCCWLEAGCAKDVSDEQKYINWISAYERPTREKHVGSQ